MKLRATLWANKQPQSCTEFGTELHSFLTFDFLLPVILPHRLIHNLLQFGDAGFICGVRA